MEGTGQTPTESDKNLIPIGKFIFGKVVGVGLLFLGANLAWLGITGLTTNQRVVAPIRALTLGLVISVVGALLLLGRRDRKFLWEDEGSKTESPKR